MATFKSDFVEEIAHVRSILPHVSDSEARHALDGAQGSVEMALHYLLEVEPPQQQQEQQEQAWEVSSNSSGGASNNPGAGAADLRDHNNDNNDNDDNNDNNDNNNDHTSEIFEEGGDESSPILDPSQEAAASPPQLSASSSVSEAVGGSTGPNLWEVLSVSTLGRALRADLEQVVEFAGVSPSAARVLLGHFGWDVRTLLERYAEDAERVCRQAGVALENSSSSSSSGRPEIGNSQCGSCLEDRAGDCLTAFASCGHRFCRDCWMSYLLLKIREGESCRLQCMSFKCGRVCDDELVAAAVQKTDPPVALRFRRAIVDAYVGENRTGNLAWCPSTPHCGQAVRLCGKATSELAAEVVCSCQKRFCFACKGDAHTPCSCEMWKRWQEKTSGESATSNWLQANSKSCPKCRKPVEKNGGCNHVRCRCGQSFCWHCGQATGLEHTYQSIANHTCGRFAEEAAEKAKVAEADLKRYLHYYGRWRSHMDSLKFEAELSGRVAEKISALDQTLQEYLADYQWLCDGAAQLSICRRILAHSYIFAFFALGVNGMFADEISREQDIVNRNLFEVKQEELEQAVESLSKLVETPLEEMVQDGSISKVKQLVLDLTVNVDLRSLHLCETAQSDILARLTSSQGIAPYWPRTQIVRRMAKNRSAPSAQSQMPSKRPRLQGT